MCGLFGIVSKDVRDALDLDRIDQITAHLKKRGPDAQRVFTQGGVTLIHARLSILDLDCRSDQPFHSSCGRYIMVYNGEVYNFKSLRTNLQQAGYHFRTSSDTEVILASYINQDVNCFRRFEGMFALAIYDLKTGEYVLARDPAGIKPLYYAADDNRAVFASDLRSLFLSGQINTSLNHQSVLHYLHFGFSGAPHTFFSGVRTLPPGCYYSSRTKKVHRYFEILPDDRFHNPAEAGEAFDEVFSRSVEDSLVSDVDVGVLLSGGIDSGLIAAKAVQLHPGIRSYSLGFSEKSYDETAKAREVANRLKIKHEVIPFRFDWRDILSRYVIDVSDPIADTSLLPTDILCQEVAKKHKVVLSGDGADELFAGYELYRYEALQDRYAGLFKLGRLALGGLKPLLKSRPHKNSAVNRLKRILELNGTAAEDHLFLRSLWGSFDLLPLIHPDLRAQAALAQCGQAYLEKFRFLENADNLTRSLYADFSYHLPGDMLVKVDRASMAHGLEVRVPFLNAGMIRFAFSLSKKLKLNGWDCQSKYLLRRQYEKIFGRRLARQQKSGFSVSLRSYFDDWIHTREWHDFGVHITHSQILAPDWKDQIKRAFVLREHQVENGLFALLILDRWLGEYLRHEMTCPQR